MAKIKLSAAMLEGFKKVEGRQCKGASSQLTKKGLAYCAVGAARAGGYVGEGFDKFRKSWGISIVSLNDDEKLPWEDLYGMAKAAGL